MGASPSDHGASGPCGRPRLATSVAGRGSRQVWPAAARDNPSDQDAARWAKGWGRGALVTQVDAASVDSSVKVTARSVSRETTLPPSRQASRRAAVLANGHPVRAEAIPAASDAAGSTSDDESTGRRWAHSSGAVRPELGTFERVTHTSAHMRLTSPGVDDSGAAHTSRHVRESALAADSGQVDRRRGRGVPVLPRARRTRSVWPDERGTARRDCHRASDRPRAQHVRGSTTV